MEIYKKYLEKKHRENDNISNKIDRIENNNGRKINNDDDKNSDDKKSCMKRIEKTCKEYINYFRNCLVKKSRNTVGELNKSIAGENINKKYINKISINKVEKKQFSKARFSKECFIKEFNKVINKEYIKEYAGKNKYFLVKAALIVLLVVAVTIQGGIEALTLPLKEVTINDNGSVISVKTRKLTVGEVLEQNGINLLPEDYISPSTGEKLLAGAINEIYIKRAVPVYI
ncbi:MAG: DUF348 domain-containing protein, partial [Clostridiaceae bacterium]|nr:DUF348 domain-containing protein [Clostridiaceae bacterium]